MSNGFRHQQYSDQPPTTEYDLLTAVIDDQEHTQAKLASIGEKLAAANVAAIYLVHGTYAGGDTFGVARELQRFVPGLGRLLAIRSKQLFDRLAKNLGNFTKQYARQLSEGINTNLAKPIDVQRFHWTGQNLHIGRADGAIRLIDQLAAKNYAAGSRVLLLGHSHAGNVFAIVSNLLAGDARTRASFFRAAKHYYRPILFEGNNLPAWDRAINAIGQGQLGQIKLDFVTLGAPIRYGWETQGYGKLLHIVFHRPISDLPVYKTHFPPRLVDFVRATGGDYIQHLAIAGTNEVSNVLNLRQWLAERRLRKIVQNGLTGDLLQRWRCGQRVADAGTTLLVDYTNSPRKTWARIAGHAVYTHTSRMAFHFSEIADRLYAGP